jgi:FkbM family methyltransferase
LIRFPARWSRYYRDGYEKETFDFFTKHIKKGDTILDIGGHIGLYCVPLSKCAGNEGRIFCFERTPATFKILLKIIALNKCLNVTPVNAAISKESGHITFNLTTDSGVGSNANSIVASERMTNTVLVQAYSADDFKRNHELKIDMMKIDVEGAELFAIIGAAEVFLKDRPLCILALHPDSIRNSGHSLHQIWDTLMQYRYKVIYEGAEMKKESFIFRQTLFDVQLWPA